jgi:hypothetical protein
MVIDQDIISGYTKMIYALRLLDSFTHPLDQAFPPDHDQGFARQPLGSISGRYNGHGTIGVHVIGLDPCKNPLFYLNIKYLFNM